MPEDEKTFFDRWMDKKVENVVDTSADALTRKLRIYLTAFYLVAMLVYVTYSVICLNEIGKMSDVWAIVIGGGFYLAFVVMAVFSIWSILKAGAGVLGRIEGLGKMYRASKIMRRVLGLFVYVLTVITLFETWDQGVQYRLFSSIMLIAFTAGNLWIVVSDIFQKKLEKQLEIQRAIEEAKKREEEKKKNAIKEKVKVGASWVSERTAQALKNRENKESRETKEPRESKFAVGEKLGGLKKTFSKTVQVSEIEEDVEIVEIKSEDIEW